MKNPIKNLIRLSVVIAFSLPFYACGGSEAETATDAAAEEVAIGEEVGVIDGVPVREDFAMVHVAATVEAISHELRIVTLKGPAGNVFTVNASEEVERIDEIAVGDTVNVDYLTSLAFELREPTEEEIAEPLVVLDEVARAPKDMLPGGGEITVVRAVCTIEGLDRQTGTAKLLGPMGNYREVGGVDPENMPLLTIGQTVVVTYTEAVAITLEKAEVVEVEEEAAAEG